MLVVQFTYMYAFSVRNSYSVVRILKVELLLQRKSNKKGERKEGKSRKIINYE